MPKIGDINVPEELWQDVVRSEMYYMVHTFLAGGSANADMGYVASQFPYPLDLNNPENVGGDYYDAIYDRLAALIKAQTGKNQENDPSFFDKEIGNIQGTAHLFIAQLTVDTLFNLDHLKAVVEKKLKATSPPSMPLD